MCLNRQGDEPFVQAVLQGLPCGCKVVGNGTCPKPFTVELCKNHKRAGEDAAAKLLEELFELNGQLSSAMCNLGNCLRATGENHQPHHAHMDLGRICSLAAKAYELALKLNSLQS